LKGGEKMSDPSPDRHWYLWGKSPKPSKGVYIYHPLLYHLIDVAMVARALWRTAMAPATKSRIAQTLALPDETTAGNWLAFLAGLHDIGKGAPGFVQGKWSAGLQQILSAGFEPPSSKAKTPHGFITAAVLTKLLPTLNLDSEVALPAARIVAAHHGVFPNAHEFSALVASLGGRKWAEARHDIAFQLLRACDLEGTSVPSGDLEREPWLMMVLAGLTAVADWIGSDKTYFPHVQPGCNLLDYRRDAQEKADRALAENGWAWQGSSASLTFEQIFPFTPNQLQKAVVAMGDTLDAPAVVLVESPMGGGKTEAALFLSDQLAQRHGQHGCYFALPTQATSNQMFRRMRAFLGARYTEEIVGIQLLHGHAALSAEFAKARRNADRLITPDSVEGDEGYDDAPANVVAAEWFTQRKRGLLAPFGIGTVDQALLSVLQARHYFVRLFGLAGKVVVIDEVHAYDAYMSQLLERLLEWLASLGCSVILLSATLPARRRGQLLDAFARGMGVSTKPLTETEPYPRLTWATAQGPGQCALERKPGPKVVIQWKDGHLPVVNDAPFPLGEALRSALGDSGCAAIVCNTVGRAQRVYEALKRYFPSSELDLFHARFLFEDRDLREQRTELRFGPPGTAQRPRRFVLVATQVIEQSLDLDFDLLVTDLAPADLVLQRIGRLHRHQRDDRPHHLFPPTVWILMPDLNGQGIPQFRHRVYDHHILLRSWLVLRDRSHIRVPVDIEPVVEEVYGPAEPPPAVAEFWKETLLKLEENRAKAEEIARSHRIAEPDPDWDHLRRSNEQLEEENPAVHARIHALTRLSDPAVNTVVLFDTPFGPSLTPDGALPLSLTVLPDRALTLQLLARSVNLTHSELVPELLRQAAPEGWRQSPWLRHCRLLLLDQGGVAMAGRWQVTVDPELGVIIRRGGTECDE
jgi:CRISPR-associated endonuclease/helicase Cas3